MQAKKGKLHPEVGWCGLEVAVTLECEGDCGDFEVGSGELARGFDDVIYDDFEPRLFAPLAKEETFSSLELDDYDNDENKVFDRGEFEEICIRN